MTDFEVYLRKRKKPIEAALRQSLRGNCGAPPVLAQAMRHAVMNGGKRLRPALLLAAASAYGLPEKKVMPAACAFELTHCFSLVHDDLPALDNDALRRGKPTVHTLYGEATALLAGDALLIAAFELMAKLTVPPARALRAAALLAQAAGAAGMTGGQTADLFAEGLPRESLRLKQLKKVGAKGAKQPLPFYLLPDGKAEPEKVLRYIHLHKTAAMLAAPLEAGAALAGAPDSELAHLRAFGLDCGLAFQISDDILDVTGDKRRLGKRGSDRDNGKLTYVSLYGLEQSRKMVYSLLARAKKRLAGLKKPDQSRLGPLYGLADFLAVRNY